MNDLLVVGAGPAGLTAAWRAARAGRSVRLIDRAPAVGGMAASIEVAGQRVDLGSHRLHPSIAPPLLDAVVGLLGDDLQRRPRHGRLRIGERWIGFPLRPAAVPRLPPKFAAGLVADAATRPFRRPPGDTFAGVVRARLGSTMLDQFYGPYAWKLWDTDPGELDGELARRRISTRGPGELVRRMWQRDGRYFLYPRLGYGQIVERLADAAVDAGAEIELGTAASAEALTGAGRILWTGSPAGLAALLPDTPDEVRGAAVKLRHRAVVLVYLVVDRPRYTDFDAHYLPDRALPVARLSEPKNYRDGPDPPDRTVLCAEVPCWPDDDIWRASDGDLAAVVEDCLARAGLPVPFVAGAATHRLRAVYPVYDRGSRQARQTVDRWTAALADITVLGRQGLFVGDNLHHVMEMGWDAGELAGDPDGWDAGAWSARRAAYQANVVAD